MGFKNCYQDIDEYAIRIIKHKAKRLVGSAGLTDSDREDLEQEMVLDLLRRLPKFNPQRARRNTFINRIVEHKAATILESRKAGKRDYRRSAFSLNDRMENREGDSIERIETIDQEDYFRRTGNSSRPLDEMGDLTIDVREAVNRLEPGLRAFCQRLQAETVTEISRDTGVPRGTIYESIKELRDLLNDAGLKDYL